jgi:hypothetical protein
MNLQENINRIKQMMGLLTEEEQDKSNSTKTDIYREQVSDSQEFNIQPAGNGPGGNNGIIYIHL